MTALLVNNPAPIRPPAGYYDYSAPLIVPEVAPVPIRMTYGNIEVHKFHTDMGADPRHTFKLALDYAERTVDDLVKKFETEDSTSKSNGIRSWQITNGFISFNLCLHCYTQYDQSDFVAEDIATHRVVISMTANLDANKVYKSDPHATEVFAEVNQLYADIKSAFM